MEDLSPAGILNFDAILPYSFPVSGKTCMAEVFLCATGTVDDTITCEV